MLKIGLTGNYCSGHNEVGKIFTKCNIPVFEADLILKYLLYRNTETIEKLQEKYGKKIFTNNVLDITYFNDKKKFESLIRYIELELIRAFERWRLKLDQKTPYVLFKSQIIHEIGWEYFLNYSISVFRPNGNRSIDIQKLHKMSSTDVYELMNNEMDPFQKNRLCEYVIHNYASYSDTLEKQVLEIHDKLRKKA